MGSVGATLGRFTLAGLFASVPRLAVSIETRGIEYDLGAPRTIYAITHKRDLDAFAPLPILLGHRGWRALTHDVHFAMRSDSFDVGFISRIVARPAWFARLLRAVSVGPILRAVGVHPLDGLHLRPAETWIREALDAEGDAPIGALLAPDMLRRLALESREPFDTLAARPLSSLLAWRHFPSLQPLIGPEVFALPARRRAERRVLAAAKLQLAECVAWLDAGGSLYTSPEGRLSPDGRLSPVRAGLARILRDAPADTRVLPIAIVYDYMTTERPRMWIDFAPAIEGGGRLSRHDLERRLRAVWLGAARFTCTQLASGLLMQRLEREEPPLGATALADAVGAWAAELAAAGRRVDPRLLAREGVRRRMARYLGYAERHRIARRRGDTLMLSPTALAPLDVVPGDVGYRSSPLRYAWNEAREMLDARPLAAHSLTTPSACAPHPPR